MGWFLSEGYTSDRDKEFGISQSKPEGRIQIEQLLKECGFSYRVSATAFHVSSPAWWSYLRQFGKCRHKFIPRNIYRSKHLDSFFKCLMAGDGHWHKQDNSGIYYTISKHLADDVCEVAVLLGYSVKLKSRQRENRDGLCYEVAVTRRKVTEMCSSDNGNITKTQFDGEVYCITVPETEVFFVRQNGYVWLSGNTWVKKMFIDPAPYGKAFWATDMETGKVMAYPEGHAKAGTPLFKRRFIPARLSDNPHLARSGDYEAMLLSLPEMQRKQLLEGDWDVAEGAAFSEFNRSIHVVEPFEIPHDWTRFRACDYGYGSYSAVLWFAIAPDDSLIVYRELYVSKVLAEDLAIQVLQLEEGERIRYGVLDSSCWAKRGDTGPSIAERMIIAGCKWRPADRSAGSRVAGKNEIHRRLQIDEYTGNPRMVLFSNCVNTIAHLPALPIDKNNAEDIDTKVNFDHTYDALRYGVMSRPRSGSIFDQDSRGRGSGMSISDNIFGY